MNQGEITILLVDNPGYLRDALQSLISSKQEWSRVETADTGRLALTRLAEVQPALVLMGQGLSLAEISELTRQIKRTWPGTLCLALVEMAPQAQSIRLAGVDQVVWSSMPREQIFAVIEAALQHEADREKSRPSSDMKGG